MTALALPTINDRLKAALRAFIRAEDPNRTYRGVYAYQVQATNGTTVDASPSDTSISLPALRGVPILTGIAGASVTPAIGSKCGIGFLNGDPTQPFVLGVFDSNAAQSVTLNAGTGTSEHVTTIEAVTNVLANLLMGLGVSASPGGSSGANSLATALFALSTPVTAQVYAMAAVAAAASPSTGTLSPVTMAGIKAALAAKTGDLLGTQPGVGCPNISAG